MLTPQASNSTGLNWTGGGVTVYCAVGWAVACGQGAVPQ